MVFVYLSIGILLVFLLHSGLKWFAHASPARVRQAGKWVFALIVIAAIFMLIRFGLLHLAAILSFLSVAAPLWQKFRGTKSPSAGNAADTPRKGRMTMREAREILGVGADATPQEIHSAHRRLIQKNHPDQGGSEYLASKINEARDVLLGK